MSDDLIVVPPPVIDLTVGVPLSIDVTVGGGGSGSEGPAGPAGPAGAAGPSNVITESSGPTNLAVGAVADGQFLKRVGATVVGAVVSGTDANAIHVNVAAEISALTSKALPAAADLLVIEDSAASNAKKKIRLDALILAGVYPTGSIPLWVPPAALGLTPGTVDTEFDSNPNWTYRDVTNGANRTPAGTPVLRTAITGSTSVPKLSINGSRRSYLVLQTPSVVGGYNADYYYPSLVTPGGPAWFWARISSPSWIVGQDPSRRYLFLAKDAAGIPDNSNRVEVGYSSNGGNVEFDGLSIAAGTPTSIPVTRPNVALNAYVTPPWEYVGLCYDSTSSAIEFWAFNENSQAYKFGSISWSNTSFWVGLRLINTSAQSECAHTYCDFVRQTAGLEPPWLR